jgi:TetR/AcrR family transcriptional repressor of nem operon
VGTSQADKASSHQRIVEIAATRMRERGIDGISVADIMNEAGLTHGGFYRHFASREDLVVEAVTVALAEGSARSRGVTGDDGRARRAVIDGYLSTTHRDHPETGCAVAGLGEDVARASDATREAYTDQVQRYIDLLVSLDARSSAEDTRRAVLTLSALVGALSMARAVKDPVLSERILRETADLLKSLGEAEQPNAG